jgi:hypothetical protein
VRIALPAKMCTSPCYHTHQFFAILDVGKLHPGPRVSAIT